MAGLHATIGILAALQPAARDRPRPARRGQPAVLGAVRAGQPVQRVRRRRRRARSGWATATRACSPTSRCPCADGDLIITAGNNGQFRKLVEVLGVPELADDPRFARNEDRTANRDELRPLLVERLRTRTDDGVVPRHHRAPACRAARSTPSTAASRSPRRSASTRSSSVGEGDAAVPSVRNPITFSETPADYRLPPPALDEHGDEIRALAAEDDDAIPTRRRCSSRPRWAPPTADQIRLLGQDLTADLMGKVGFGELAFWLVAMRRPTPAEVRVFEAVLVALADHGFTPTAIAARLTYLSAPDSLQGALAAGLLGGGSRFLGVTEDCGRYLHDVLDDARRRPARPTTPAGTRSPSTPYAATREAGRFVPGLGHPVHKVERPAHAGADRGSPRRRACAARTCGCSRRSAGCTSRCSAAGCRSTAPGSAAPRWPTSACRSSCCAASRCWPGRPGCSARSPRSAAARSAWTSTSTVDRNAVYVDPTDPSPTGGGACMATVVAVIASTHHPFYYRASTSTGADRPPFADEWVSQDRDLPRDADPGPARRAGDGRQRPLPPAVAGQHAAVPGRQGAVLRRQLVQRGARVRPAADDASRATRSCPRTSCATASTPTSTWPSATSCGSTTASPARSSRCGPRPTCRSCRSTPTSSRRRCRSRSGSSQLGRAIRAAGRVVAERPAGGDHRHRPPVARARRPAPVRRARPGPGVRPQGRRVDRQRRPRGLPAAR